MMLPGLELNTFAFEALTVSNTAVGCTAATSLNATAALFGPVESSDVRWRADGTDPTTTVGHKLAAASYLYIEGADTLRKIKFIRTAAPDATIPTTYYH